MSEHILVVEDDTKIAQFISSELLVEGYKVTVSHDGIDALNIARECCPDLIILDWMLPRISGLDICLRLRKTGVKIPIIMLTARDEITERVLGLDSGADDYVTKPFSMEELLARAKARLRRIGTDTDSSETLEFEDLHMNLLTREVYRAKQSIELTAKEFDLLEYLLRHPLHVLSRNQILENVWGYYYTGESNIVDVYIRALRLKLELNHSSRLIHTVRGVGYVLRI
ncbi:response regulator transcription factor [Cyanothece sp. BG0011]|uniref:response regulator transcription factor n=1 Tax=Cyanothece sp. BG0011 TaxID=2082950 RepID=UPI000D1E95E1|nr:response regulator transcription factor [Cyanothece sp. BG0011]